MSSFDFYHTVFTSRHPQTWEDFISVFHFLLPNVYCILPSTWLAVVAKSGPHPTRWCGQSAWQESLCESVVVCEYTPLGDTRRSPGVPPWWLPSHTGTCQKSTIASRCNVWFFKLFRLLITTVGKLVVTNIYRKMQVFLLAKHFFSSTVLKNIILSLSLTLHWTIVENLPLYVLLRARDSVGWFHPVEIILPLYLHLCVLKWKG